MGYSKVPIGKDADLKRFQRKLNRFELTVRNKIFPFRLEWLLWTMVGIAVLNVFGVAPMNFTIDKMTKTLTYHFGSSAVNRLISIALIGGLFSYLCIFLIRCAFTLILYYNGWIFESVGKSPSLPTKAFMILLHLVNKYATFFSFNDLLPWLFVPNLDTTVDKYLKTVRPIYSDERYNEVVQFAEDFKKTVGPGLQKKLWMKWLTSKNYVSDWWKEIVYMRYRNSLINTNVGCADVIYQQTTNIQAARAANVTLIRLQFCRETFVKQCLKPITLGGIPLCANQYIDYHRSLRVPGEISDEMVRLPDARHVAVYCKGCWYKLNIFHGRRLLRPAEFERALQSIIDRTPEPLDHEEHLSALTAGPRDLWARIRKNKFDHGLNRESLTAIEDALEIIFLDDEEREYDENDTTKYDYEYARTLHGNGYQLWCDKPSVYIFSKNGRFSSNAEHSVVDAMIYVHIREYIKYQEEFVHPYTKDGHCRGEVEVVPSAERLLWKLDEETKTAIDEAYSISKAVAHDFENASIVFHDFGKNFIKKVKVSPDAFIQMALQMAYFRDQGKFELTYEPAVMRLFKDGRTETVRSCSVESCDFVKAMEDTERSDVERLELLRKACDYHQDYYRHAMVGHGVDRHLFALYIVAKYLQIDSPFLESVFNTPYALSTSQTPQHQMVEYSKELGKDNKFFWPAGAFCCPEGSNYGVCYTIGATGDDLSFHIATWKSLSHTNAYRFRDQILKCLREMKKMVDGAHKNA
ncbi:hypothetical protein QR680_003839 [Steinernema hermaphroditum]|uniref:Choline/carnitine acyltransferase domain-containing protein n=1 Tax=Steinernema hermaphroditum TaxID=289476 RepID=A0AA39HMT2_9BILA|nr:hypothetical protein QR680_003839 [Steinernema hermaphroditum]